MSAVLSVILSLLVITLVCVALVVVFNPDIMFILFGLLADASFKRREDGSFSAWHRVGQVVIWCIPLGAAVCVIYEIVMYCQVFFPRHS